MWIFEDIHEFFTAFLHLTIVGLHFTEIAEAKVVTIGVMVAAAYMIASVFEANKARKEIIKHHKEQAEKKQAA